MFDAMTFRLPVEGLDFEYAYRFSTVYAYYCSDYAPEETCLFMVDKLFPPRVRRLYPLRERMQATGTANRFTTLAYSRV